MHPKSVKSSIYESQHDFKDKSKDISVLNAILHQVQMHKTLGNEKESVLTGCSIFLHVVML